MSRRYQAYPEYKNSGVDWFKEIPKNWRIAGFKKYLESIVDYRGKTPNKTDSGVLLVTARNVKNGSLDYTLSQEYISDADYDDVMSRGKPKIGDLLFTTEAPLGEVANIDITEIALAQRIIKFCGRTGELDNYYFKYLMMSKEFQQSLQLFASGSTVKGIKAERFVYLRILLPSFSEQQKIANFLDHETAKMDRLIEKQEQLIALLKEKRQAVISHAVTKGLNPNAPMRDSGVPWLGKIPAHWEVLKTKRFFRLECHPAPKNNDLELLSIYTEIGVKPRKDLEQKGNKASTTDGYWLVEKGDLIVNKLLAWMGAIGYSDYSGVTSPAYDILRKRRPLEPKFYHYLFRTKQVQTEFKRWSRGIMEMRLRLYFEELGQIQMPFPPLSEQIEIVHKIEKIEQQYEELIKKAESLIGLLSEKRTALISAAVTGKIDVRKWQPPENQLEIKKETNHE